MNARMLGEYDPRVTGGSCPPLVILRSSEGFNPPGVSDVPVWLADRSDPKIATTGWETLAPVPVKVIDIPGNHFTPFYPTNVSAHRLRCRCSVIIYVADKRHFRLHDPRMCASYESVTVYLYRIPVNS